MNKENLKSYPWDFYSKLILISFSFLQILRWRIFPQFVDIYYHTLTAWGFIEAGGYSSWDFWQYAPLGRPHIYPPFFHIILSVLLKLGIDKIFIAKFFETIVPILFLVTLWYFMKKNYSGRLSFFILVMAASSFSFYISLSNNIPATLAVILGFFVFHYLFRKKFLRALLLLALCFYTHIGVSWFFAFSVLLFGLLNRQYRKLSLLVCLSAIILSAPILIKQFYGLRLISLSGINEKYFCEFKPVDYLLALSGLIMAFMMKEKYFLFPGLFFASFIFLFYPYRFFSAQGYLPIACLCALSLDLIYERLKNNEYLKSLAFVLAAFIMLISPTILMYKPNEADKSNYRLYFFDSALVNIVLPAYHQRIASAGLWFPNEYLPISKLIRENCEKGDIIYSRFHILGVCLSAISGRATANGLFSEMGIPSKFDPLSASKMVVAFQDEDRQWLKDALDKHNLIEVGENKYFILYKNPSVQAKVDIKKATVPFWAIWLIGFTFVLLFLSGR